MEDASYKVLDSEVFRHVYKPYHDTYILIDSLKKEMETIKKIKPTVCVEVGCGSGVVISTLAKALGQHVFYLGIDVNPHAAKATKLTSESNNVKVDVVLADVVKPFKDRLKGKVDVLLFNAPYGVTSEEEMKASNLLKATSGGIMGREVMDKLFPLVPEVLSPNGIFILICKKENDIDDIKNLMASYNLKMTILFERPHCYVHLFALRFSY